jgi:hypothetical protein
VVKGVTGSESAGDGRISAAVNRMIEEGLWFLFEEATA